MKKENVNSQINDLDIISGIKARDENILSLAMKKYEHYFFAIGEKILFPYGTSEDISECFVDTWLYIWNKIETYDDKGYAFLNWCLLIFKSRVINRRILNIKQITKYQKIVLHKLAKVDIDEILINKESYNALVHKLHLLPSPKKEIFLMRYIENKSLREISFKTKLSIQKIYYHIHTGKILLRSYLQD